MHETRTNVSRGTEKKPQTAPKRVKRIEIAIRPNTDFVLCALDERILNIKVRRRLCQHLKELHGRTSTESYMTDKLLNALSTVFFWVRSNDCRDGAALGRVIRWGGYSKHWEYETGKSIDKLIELGYLERFQITKKGARIVISEKGMNLIYLYDRFRAVVVDEFRALDQKTVIREAARKRSRRTYPQTRPYGSGSSKETVSQQDFISS